MVDTIIWTLIYIGFIVAIAWVVIWALRSFGLVLPEQVIKIFWVIVVLLIILMLWHMLAPLAPAGHSLLK